MMCQSCGRESLTGEPRCPDCAPLGPIDWPKSTWFQTRLKELQGERKEQGDET